MLAACREASAIEWVMVAPGVAGVELPEYLREEQLVRLNLVAGRDTPEVLLDEWGIRCALTFRGRRSRWPCPGRRWSPGRCAPPERKKPRFGVIQGGKKDSGAAPGRATEADGRAAAGLPEAPRQLLVSAEGIEPSTYGLRVHCSAS